VARSAAAQPVSAALPATRLKQACVVTVRAREGGDPHPLGMLFSGVNGDHPAVPPWGPCLPEWLLLLINPREAVREAVRDFSLTWRRVPGASLTASLCGA
jgi:hypothetical protein